MFFKEMVHLFFSEGMCFFFREVGMLFRGGMCSSRKGCVLQGNGVFLGWAIVLHGGCGYNGEDLSTFPRENLLSSPKRTY